MLHQIGDLFELNVKLRCQNVKSCAISKAAGYEKWFLKNLKTYPLFYNSHHFGIPFKALIVICIHNEWCLAGS